MCQSESPREVVESGCIYFCDLVNLDKSGKTARGCKGTLKCTPRNFLAIFGALVWEQMAKNQGGQNLFD